MAKDDDYRKIREKRDQEDAEEAAEKAKRNADIPTRGTKTGPAGGSFSGASRDPAQLDTMLLQAEPLIEQVNSLYNQYLAGVERAPPIERRKLLEQLMAAILATPKPTQSYQFRANGTNSKYLTYRDRWDRMMKDLESGKIKRLTKR